MGNIFSDLISKHEGHSYSISHKDMSGKLRVSVGFAELLSNIIDSNKNGEDIEKTYSKLSDLGKESKKLFNNSILYSEKSREEDKYSQKEIRDSFNEIHVIEFLVALITEGDLHEVRLVTQDIIGTFRTIEDAKEWCSMNSIETYEIDTLYGDARL